MGAYYVVTSSPLEDANVPTVAAVENPWITFSPRLIRVPAVPVELIPYVPPLIVFAATVIHVRNPPVPPLTNEIEGTAADSDTKLFPVMATSSIKSVAVD